MFIFPTVRSRIERKVCPSRSAPAACWSSTIKSTTSSMCCLWRTAPCQTTPFSSLPELSRSRRGSCGFVADGPIGPRPDLLHQREGLGPPNGVVGQFDSNGFLERQVIGVEVLVNGIPAPVFFAGDGQINAQAPYSLQQVSQARVSVSYFGESSNEVVMAWRRRRPACLSIRASRARVGGSHRRLAQRAWPAHAGRGHRRPHATGEGVTTPPLGDGAPAADPYPRPTASVTLLINGQRPTCSTRAVRRATLV